MNATSKQSKPKSYKYPLYVPAEVYELMVSSKGVGTAKTLFGLAGTDKHFHNPAERHPFFKTVYVAWYKRRRDVISVLVWLIDWYHAAKNPEDKKCYFPNWGLMCGLI